MQFVLPQIYLCQSLILMTSSFSYSYMKNDKTTLKKNVRVSGLFYYSRSLDCTAAANNNKQTNKQAQNQITNWKTKLYKKKCFTVWFCKCCSVCSFVVVSCFTISCCFSQFCFCCWSTFLQFSLFCIFFFLIFFTFWNLQVCGPFWCSVYFRLVFCDFLLWLWLLGLPYISLALFFAQ